MSVRRPPHEAMPPQDGDGDGDNAYPPGHPTHKLKDIKVGDNSVQLLVSTKDHLYDADTVQTGSDSCQVIGAWDDAAVGELSSFLSARQQNAARGGGSQSATYGTQFGRGRTLGTQ